MKSKLSIAKQLRREHGSITCYDHTIYFENGKFFESNFTCEGELRSSRIDWREVLRVIKNGTYT